MTNRDRLTGLQLETAQDVGRAMARHHERMRELAAYGGFKAPGDREALVYAALGLASEAGEVAGAVQKGLRVDDPYARQGDLVLELGDVLYYWNRVVALVGYSPAHVVACNYHKLIERQAEARAAAGEPRRALSIVEVRP